METLDHKPLPARVRDRIWELIQQGHYRTGEQLPSEQSLAARFGVSRATVREALKILEEEGLILCRHGVGRLVTAGASGILSEAITNLKSVTEMAGELAIPLSTQVLALREELPDDVVRTRLNLQPGMGVVVLERVRLAHSEPVIYSIDIFPRAIVVGELRAEMFAGSLLAVMEGEWETRLAYSRAIISAVLLDPELSQQIGVPDSPPWILLEQINYDTRDRPVLYSKDYHRGDKFQFHVLRRRR
jgi:GntR family transcriptional regulator